MLPNQISEAKPTKNGRVEGVDASGPNQEGNPGCGKQGINGLSPLPKGSHYPMLKDCGAKAMGMDFGTKDLQYLVLGHAGLSSRNFAGRLHGPLDFLI